MDVDKVIIIKNYKYIGFIIRQVDIDENTINRRISVGLKMEISFQSHAIIMGL